MKSKCLGTMEISIQVSVMKITPSAPLHIQVAHAIDAPDVIQGGYVGVAEPGSLKLIGTRFVMQSKFPTPNLIK